MCVQLAEDYMKLMCTLSACSVLDTISVCVLCVQLAEDNMKLIMYTVSV